MKVLGYFVLSKRRVDGALRISLTPTPLGGGHLTIELEDDEVRDVTPTKELEQESPR